jgi:chromosome segregation ATPase
MWGLPVIPALSRHCPASDRNLSGGVTGFSIFRMYPAGDDSGGKEETKMEVKDYCSNVATELTGWKAKMYDVARQLDKKSTGEKEKFAPQINEIHMIIEELTERIEKLQKECPTEWKPDETEINANMARLKDKMKDVWDPLHIGV